MIKNIDIDLFRSFITIYETNSFSVAADQLGRTQSTISQQIKKLEHILGHGVFIRNNRSIQLTTEGEILLPYARRMVSMNDEVLGKITQPNITGTVKLGAPEAFAAHHLPNILVQFSKSHPSVALDIHCDLSNNLLTRFEKDNFDIILIKRDSKTKIQGHKIWKENLVWAGLEKYKFHMGDAVPLILSPFPCVYRNKIITALDKKKIKWTNVFTSASMMGRIAAAKAGLGITVIPKEMLSQIHNLMSLGDDSGLPNLSSIEIDLLQNLKTINDASQRLANHIIFSLENDPSINLTA